VGGGGRVGVGSLLSGVLHVNSRFNFATNCLTVLFRDRSVTTRQSLQQP